MIRSHMAHIPVPDELLLPLVEEAADTLRSLESVDVPNSLKHIHGFDRRGLLAGPGRRQLLRALENDERFCALVVERFSDRDEVRATLDAWSPADAVACIDAANARHDLPLLASALWAVGPEGAEFGLGLVVSRAADARHQQGAANASRAQERELAEVEEARRRADVARMEAEADVARALEELQKERGARRGREEKAVADAKSARDDVERFERELKDAAASLEEERLRTERERKRAHALEADVKRLRSELENEVRRAAEAHLEPHDARAVIDAAASAERAAASLRAIERRLRERPPAAPAETPAPARRVPSAPSGRCVPTLPSGLVADSPSGVEAMLQTPDVVLVIDGYNVTKKAWPEATAADQRERLGIATTALHRRLACGVVIVFDGDGSGVARPTLRRGGVRVLFSDASEEADEVVVRETGALPKRVPVIVASSDGWVRQHAEAEGAVVVGAEALLKVLRPDR